MDIVSFPAPVDVQRAAPSGPPAEPKHASFKEVLSELGRRMDSGEASVNAALQAAPKMGPAGELLKLQAGVYRYTETFEVASKLVDKATNAIKTTLQGQ